MAGADILYFYISVFNLFGIKMHSLGPERENCKVIDLSRNDITTIFNLIFRKNKVQIRFSRQKICIR